MSAGVTGISWFRYSVVSVCGSVFSILLLCIEMHCICICSCHHPAAIVVGILALSCSTPWPKVEPNIAHIANWESKQTNLCCHSEVGVSAQPFGNMRHVEKPSEIQESRASGWVSNQRISSGTLQYRVFFCSLRGCT